MAVEPSYVPNRQESREFGERIWDESEIRDVLESGIFILAEPDTRLQDIVEEWNTQPHHDAWADDLRFNWPRLTALLDALTKEEKT